MADATAEQRFWEAELCRFLPDPGAALEEAFEYLCCPVCKVLANMPFDYFRFLPPRWEGEPRLRESVCRAGGFCNHHTWRLSKIQALLPIATAYAEILAAQRDAGTAPEPCPVCRLQRLAEQALIARLVERLADPSRREEYSHAFGLCYPHFHQALACEPDESVRSAVIGAQRERSEALIGLLRAYIEKDEVPARWSRTDAEVRSPRWALLKTAGNEDL